MNIFDQQCKNMLSKLNQDNKTTEQLQAELKQKFNCLFPRVLINKLRK